jgi:Zn-dependent metalloprotease
MPVGNTMTDLYLGYMETATGLIYHYQLGAMDEAFADILGESVD